MSGLEGPGRKGAKGSAFAVVFSPEWGGERVPGASPGRWHCRAAEPGGAAGAGRAALPGMCGHCPRCARDAVPNPGYAASPALRMERQDTAVYPGVKFIRFEERLLGHLFSTAQIL